jgi:hypothetical protein
MSLGGVWSRVRSIGSSRLGRRLLGFACAFGLACPTAALAVGDERGVERVSPQIKGADVDVGGKARAASTGDVVAYMSYGSFGGPASRGIINEFRGVRTPNGWTTVGMNPPFDPFPATGQAQEFQAVSEDGLHGVGRSWNTAEFGRPQMYNLWRFNASGSSFDLITNPLVALAPEKPPFRVSSGNHFAGASEDFSHIVFKSARALTADAPPEGPFLTPDRYMYEWSDGQLRLVNLLPDDEGGGIVDGAALGYGDPYGQGAWFPGEHAVSADGSRVFFNNDPSPGGSSRGVYVREGFGSAAASVGVSVSERTDCAEDPMCGGDGEADPAPEAGSSEARFQGAHFQVASPDGSEAFFISPYKLTDDATATLGGGLGSSAGVDSCASGRCDLYVWHADGPAGDRVEDLTVGDLAGGGVIGTIGASKEASRIYFVATGVLALGGQQGEPNVYLWERSTGGIRFVATLDGSPDPNATGGPAQDRGVWDRSTLQGEPTDRLFSESRVSGSGRFLLLRSREQLTGVDTGGTFQLYRFDAVDESIVCVSCNPDGSVPSTSVFLKHHRKVRRPPWLSRNVSSDGRVFFETAEALVAGDTNGRLDVYEWADGVVRLISSGTDGSDSAFLDADESGRDLFFTTRAQLVKSDGDDLVDLYDARIGGGFDEVEAPTPCVGDPCQGAQTPAPVAAVLSTEVVQSAEGVARSKARKPARKACRKGFVRKRGRGKVRCVKKPTRSRHGGRGR